MLKQDIRTIVENSLKLAPLILDNWRFSIIDNTVANLKKIDPKAVDAHDPTQKYILVLGNKKTREVKIIGLANGETEAKRFFKDKIKKMSDLEIIDTFGFKK